MRHRSWDLLDHLGQKRLIAAAYEAGAEFITSGTMAWHLAGRCSAPLNLKRAPPPGLAWTNQELQMQVRCRTCENCLRQRAREWAARAARETGFWPVSWFCTMTLAPDQQYRLRAQTVARLLDKSVDFEALAAGEQFGELCDTIYRTELQDYWKRVRAETGKPMRFMCVAEAHKSGLPHFHALVHEVERYTEVAWDTFSVLKSQWRLGHFDASGIDRQNLGSVWYVTKYLSKDAIARVRASAFYGNIPHVVELLAQRNKVRKDTLPKQKKLC